MAEELLRWTEAALAAKLLAGMARREFGLAPDFIAARRGGLKVDLAYIWLLSAFVVVNQWVGTHSALILAFTIRAATLLSTKALVAANHYILEFLVMVLFLRLREPANLGAALQVLAVSVWLYAAFQKLYHREFVNGAFFYIAFQDNRPPRRWPGMAKRVGRIDGYFAGADEAGIALCRRLAIVTIVTEVLAPLLAFAGAGTWWGAAVLGSASVVIGVMSGETSFMITNLILSAFFLLPFEPSALGSAISDPIVGIVLCYCLAWPAIHAVMTRRLVISSWKLGGWGMYATTLPTISTVGPTGTLITQTTGSAPLGVLLTLGACRLRGLRTFAVRTFLRWHPDAQHVHGFVFAWLRRRRDTFVTQCVVIRTEGDTRDVFVLDDDARVSQFREHVIALATGKTCAPNPDRDAIEMPTGLAREHAR